jgi:hypothetical protein
MQFTSTLWFGFAGSEKDLNKSKAFNGCGNLVSAVDEPRMYAWAGLGFRKRSFGIFDSLVCTFTGYVNFGRLSIGFLAVYVCDVGHMMGLVQACSSFT